jgi:syntaxin 7
MCNFCLQSTKELDLVICRQDFLQLENEVVLNEAAIEEREQGIQEIYQQIGEVNEIFKELADLVNEQGYLIG